MHVNYTWTSRQPTHVEEGELIVLLEEVQVSVVPPPQMNGLNLMFWLYTYIFFILYYFIFLNGCDMHSAAKVNY